MNQQVGLLPEIQRGLRLTKLRAALLLSYAAATVLLVPLEWYLPGAAAGFLCAWLCWRDPSPSLRRRMGVLLLCTAILAAAPIDTDTRPIKFLTLGGSFLACVILPAVLLRRSDPGVIRFRLWPRRFRWLDIFYLIISVPLAHWVLAWYFRVNPYMPQQWPLPPEPDDLSMTRLFWGINGVGVWDELFFVNTVYAVLRSMFTFWVSNLVQAVVYTSVLNHMAFIGIGPILVYLFALTQGSMFEESENLLYVIVVHLIVDYFLYWEIVMGHYPTYVQTGFFH
jgi:hypothetical protein